MMSKSINKKITDIPHSYSKGIPKNKQTKKPGTYLTIRCFGKVNVKTNKY